MGLCSLYGSVLSQPISQTPSENLFQELKSEKPSAVRQKSNKVNFFNEQNRILKRAFGKRAGDEGLRNPEYMCFGAVFYPQFVPFWGRRRGVFGEENRVQCDSYELPRTF